MIMHALTKALVSGSTRNHLLALLTCNTASLNSSRSITPKSLKEPAPEWEGRSNILKYYIHKPYINLESEQSPRERRDQIRAGSGSNPQALTVKDAIRG